MTAASAVLSIVRLAKPQFRSNVDKLAFAVHAYVLTQGYKLVAGGTEAEDPAADFTVDREEVDPSGWDSLAADGVYSFRYQDTERKRPPLYMKCIVAGPKLLLQWMSGSEGSTQILELDTAMYTTEEASSPQAYQNADELVKLLDSGPGQALNGASTTTTTATAHQKASSPTQQRDIATEQEQEHEQRRAEARHDTYISPLQEGPVRYPGSGGGAFPFPPVGVGYDDVVPPGVVRPPGYMGEVFPGSISQGPPHTGGGMHVGPDHPMFGAGRLDGVGGGVRSGQQGGGGGGVGGLPPGARWDPIAPPGMPGFRPDDFQNQPGRSTAQRPPVHPDVMQPGAGKGTDWTSFYG